MQFLSLFSLINIQYSPEVLLSYYKSLGVATLEFLPNVFDILPGNLNPANDPENEFHNIFERHPSLEGKNFLYNIGNTISLMAMTGFAFLMVLGLSYFWKRAESWYEKYKKNGVYGVLMATFLEIFLATCVQVIYVFCITS